MSLYCEPQRSSSSDGSAEKYDLEIEELLVPFHLARLPINQRRAGSIRSFSYRREISSRAALHRVIRNIVGNCINSVLSVLLMSFIRSLRTPSSFITRTPGTDVLRARLAARATSQRASGVPPCLTGGTLISAGCSAHRNGHPVQRLARLNLPRRPAPISRKTGCTLSTLARGRAVMRAPSASGAIINVE